MLYVNKHYFGNNCELSISRSDDKFYNDYFVSVSDDFGSRVIFRGSLHVCRDFANCVLCCDLTEY